MKTTKCDKCGKEINRDPMQDVSGMKKMNNTDRHPECHMRTALGNCDPIGGFCTSINESVCEGLHKVSRPQGEWINEYHGNGWNDYWDYICSNCGKKYERADNVLYKSNYCPNCGVRMKGVDDESTL